MRSPQARGAVEGKRGNLDSLRGHKYCLLTTFKRSGEPVPTPLWFGLADGRLYFRTYADAVKLKRIRNNSRVLVGPCDPRGKPKGPMTEATARIVSNEEEPAAEGAVQSNYGLFRRLYKSSFSGRVEDAYVEVTPG
ncbi:MAG: PPOX class F420-dependent oxidoreductase [Solirubrobacterales bacterium]